MLTFTYASEKQSDTMTPRRAKLFPLRRPPNARPDARVIMGAANFGGAILSPSLLTLSHAFQREARAASATTNYHDIIIFLLRFSFSFRYKNRH